MIREKIKKSKWIILSFLVPLAIMLFIMLVMQIAPFGQYSLLVSDCQVQYIDRITGFRNIMLHGKSYFYTWSQIQGSTPFAFIGFDPFYLFYLLVSEDHVVDMVTIVTCLKMACAGASCAFYLRKAFRRNDITISIFSWCYALMGFSIAYHFLLGFENGVILLPIVLYGVEKLLKDKEHYLFFTISLALSFMIDYYTSYMIGIYALLYFGCRYALKDQAADLKDFAQKLLHFLLSPVLAFGCSAFILIPIFSMMPGRDGLFEGSNFTMYLRYEAPALFSKLFIGSYDTILPNGLPYIYCGLIILVLIGFYFSSYAVSYKEKLLSFCLLAFMFISLTLNPLYVAWHGFKPPVYFEGRFSYLVSFTMIYLGYRGYCMLNTVTTQQLHKIFLILTAAFLLINRQTYSFIHDDSLLYTILFFAAYYMIVILMKCNKYPKAKLQLLLAVLVGFELSCNASVTIKNLDAQLKYPLKSDYTKKVEEMKEISEAINQQDDGFYRMEFVEKRGLNDGFGIGFPSVSHFDSVYNYDVKSVVGALGMTTGHNWVQYDASTPIVDTLLNIKYVTAKKENYFGYEQIGGKDGTFIYENPYAVSAGIMSSEDLNDIDEKTSPLMLQEQVLSKMLGEKDSRYYIDLPVHSTSTINNEKAAAEVVQGEDTIYYVKDDKQYAYINYEIRTKQDGPCFMSVYSSYYNGFEVYVNDQLMKPSGLEGQKSIYLGWFKANEVLQVKIKQSEANFQVKNVTFSQMDESAVKAAFDSLREHSLQITTHGETKLEGSIEVAADQPYLFTSIPFDKEWKVYVDGRQVETQKVMKAFLGVKLSPGRHDIKLSYIPTGFVLGSMASLLSILLLILIALRHHKEQSKKMSQDVSYNS